MRIVNFRQGPEHLLSYKAPNKITNKGIVHTITRGESDSTGNILLGASAAAGICDLAAVCKETNEDALVIAETKGNALLLIIDGMGGHKNGEVAAEIVGGSIVKSFFAAAGALDLPQAFSTAHAEIKAFPTFCGIDRDHFPGAVATAALIEGNKFKGLNCGDARTYLWRKGKLLLLTRDNNLFFDIYNSFGRGKKPALKFPLTGNDLEGYYEAFRLCHVPYIGETENNVVTICLGGGVAADPVLDKIIEFDLEAGDLVLLVTDGLGDYLPFKNFIEVLQRRGHFSPEEVVNELFLELLRFAPNDNVTIAAYTHLRQ
ncbi:MAG: PP2C family serine/threonine-protein phosphatase [Candidatus Margulisiibacteriota bacterium]